MGPFPHSQTVTWDRSPGSVRYLGRSYAPCLQRNQGTRDEFPLIASCSCLLTHVQTFLHKKHPKEIFGAGIFLDSGPWYHPVLEASLRASHSVSTISVSISRRKQKSRLTRKVTEKGLALCPEITG